MVYGTNGFLELLPHYQKNINLIMLFFLIILS